MLRLTSLSLIVSLCLGSWPGSAYGAASSALGLSAAAGFSLAFTPQQLAGLMERQMEGLTDRLAGGGLRDFLAEPGGAAALLEQLDPGYAEDARQANLLLASALADPGFRAYLKGKFNIISSELADQWEKNISKLAGDLPLDPRTASALEAEAVRRGFRLLHSPEPLDVSPLDRPQAERVVESARQLHFDLKREPGGTEASEAAALGASPAESRLAPAVADSPAASNKPNVPFLSREKASVSWRAALGRKVASFKDYWRQFNSSERIYIKTQVIFLAAYMIGLTILPLIVKDMFGESANTGILRAVHFGTMIFSYLFSGRIVDSNPKGRILGVSNIGRAAAYGAIGVLLLTTVPLSTALSLLAAGGAALMLLRLLARRGTRLRRSAPLLITLLSVAMSVVLLAGAFSQFTLISQLFPGLLASVPALGGLTFDALVVLVMLNALVVGPYGLLGIQTGKGPLYVFDSDEKIEKAVYLFNALWAVAMLLGPVLVGFPIDWLNAAFGRGVGVSAGALLFSALVGVTSYYYFHRIQFINEDMRPASVAGIVGNTLLTPFVSWPKALRAVFRRWVIVGRTLVETSLQFIVDALDMIILPFVVLDMLGKGAGAQGIALSLAYLGSLLASAWMGAYAQRLQARIGSRKLIFYLSVAAALSFVPTIALWHTGSLYVAGLVFLLKSLLIFPLRNRLQPEFLAALKSDPETKKNSSDITAFLQSAAMAASMAGSLVFTAMFKKGDLAGNTAGLKWVTLILAAIGGIILFSYALMRRELPYREGGYSWRQFFGLKSRAERAALGRLAHGLGAGGYLNYTEITIREHVLDDRPARIVVGEPTAENLAFVFAAHGLAPGDVHLVLDPSWLIREIQPDGSARTLLRKGVFFDADGRPFVADYSVPRLTLP